MPRPVNAQPAEFCASESMALPASRAASACLWSAVACDEAAPSAAFVSALSRCCAPPSCTVSPRVLCSVLTRVPRVLWKRPIAALLASAALRLVLISVVYWSNAALPCTNRSLVAAIFSFRFPKTVVAPGTLAIVSRMPRIIVSSAPFRLTNAWITAKAAALTTKKAFWT